MLDFEFLEEVHIFLLKCLLAMMLFLIQNVVVHILNLGMTIRESPVAFLQLNFPLIHLLSLIKLVELFSHPAPDRIMPLKA